MGLSFCVTVFFCTVFQPQCFLGRGQRFKNLVAPSPFIILPSSRILFSTSEDLEIGLGCCQPNTLGNKDSDDKEPAQGCSGDTRG